jgi:hypothetical protein
MYLIETHYYKHNICQEKSILKLNRCKIIITKYNISLCQKEYIYILYFFLHKSLLPYMEIYILRS